MLISQRAPSANLLLIKLLTTSLEIMCAPYGGHKNFHTRINSSGSKLQGRKNKQVQAGGNTLFKFLVTFSDWMDGWRPNVRLVGMTARQASICLASQHVYVLLLFSRQINPLLTACSCNNKGFVCFAGKKENQPSNPYFFICGGQMMVCGNLRHFKRQTLPTNGIVM